MRITTHTDVMDNPRYGPCKLNPGPRFLRNIVHIISVPQPRGPQQSLNPIHYVTESH